MYQIGSQIPIRAKVVSNVDGSPITSGVSVYVIRNGVRNIGSGSLTHIANGIWEYVPTSTETSETEFSVEFYHSSAVGNGSIVHVITTNYVPPDNNSILAIKAKTDKLTFDENNNVYAIATVDIDEQSLAQAIAQELGSLTYIVQPLEVSIQNVAPEGGTITGFTQRKLRASWFTQTNVSGLNLEIILYDISNTIVAHYLGSEITVTQSGDGYLINLEGDSSKTPTEGSYYYAVCDSDTDNVLFIGRCFIYQIPQV